MAKILLDYNCFVQRTAQFDNIIDSISVLEVHIQMAVVEIVFLQNFEYLINLIENVACKITCGAKYCDNSASSPIQKCKSITSAKQQMKQFNRNRPLQKLSWTMPVKVLDNVSKLLQSNEHYCIAISTHQSTIEEMRKIRNRIAHKGSFSLQEFQSVVMQYYGFAVNCMTPGKLLLSPKFTPTHMKRYLQVSRIIAKELVKHV